MSYLIPTLSEALESGDKPQDITLASNLTLVPSPAAVAAHEPASTTVAALAAPAAVVAAAPPTPAPSKPTDFRIKTLIDAGTTISGDIAAAAGLRLHGNLVGTLEVPASPDGLHGDILIDENAVMQGIVTGYRIVVKGRVDGIVIAKESLTLGPNAVITQGALYAKWTCCEGSELGGIAAKLSSTLPVDEAIANFRELVKSQVGV